MKYKHSEVFAEIKAINEDIKINLTSLQYLQFLDLYLYNAVQYQIKISPQFFDCYLSKVVAYQQIHAMAKLSSENREKMSCMFFNYLTTHDFTYLKKIYLNRGLYLGILSYWLNKARLYFMAKSPFREPNGKEGLIMEQTINELGVVNVQLFFAYFKAIEYWTNKALDFKGKIVQKYTRMTLLQAQKTYVDYNHIVELDDVTQIYLQIMSKAIDRCDSRFGVLTTFIQSWLKSAKAIVQKMVQNHEQMTSYEEMIEQYGDSAPLGSLAFESTFDLMQDLSYYSSLYDKTGCMRIKYHIPQYLSPSDLDLLNSYAQ